MSDAESMCLTDTCSQPVELPAADVSGCFLVRIYPAGNLVENLVALCDGNTSFGRDPACDIQLDDDYSSRHHATLEVADAECWVVDQGSLNGTFVNDVRIERRQLQAGDHLRIGNYVFKFLSADHPEAQYHEAVYEMMTSDGLTRIANRRYFDDSFGRELARCNRHSRPLGVLMLDVDHFKRVNDLFGHLVGDECLKELCRRVQAAIRVDDLFARVGGEEFAIVLSETGLEECYTVANRILTCVSCEPFCAERKLNLPLTVSLGIAHAEGTALRSIESFLSEADERLYEAKRGGRNRVCGPAVEVA
jgi:diguanylate cyclase (GGDEF)-like protein